VCHNTTTWDATFNHSQTSFPLTGAHTSVECLGCHAGGIYDGLSTACVSCHQQDYDGTTDPDHAAAGFPATCLDCHTTMAWTPADFDHDATYFPIYSGRHREAWDSCTDCHTQPGNYGWFSCIECHEHNDQNEVDNDHDEEPGYSYGPQTCFTCHPDGDS
jgi:hypothetical protein